MCAWQVNQTFTGLPPQGVGSGYPPRGLYMCVTPVSELAAAEKDPNWKMVQFEPKATRGWAYDPETKKIEEDPDLAGTDIRCSIGLKTNSKPNWDEELKTDMAEKAEREMSAALISHGAVTADQIAEANGDIPLDNTNFDGRECFILFDPPPPGSPPKSYPEIRYLERNDFIARVTGQKKVSWPWDNKTARGASAAAMGKGGFAGQTGAGAMVPATSAPVPTPGNVAVPPAPTPPAAAPPPPGGGFGPAPTAPPVGTAPAVPDNGAPPAAGLVPPAAVPAAAPAPVGAWGKTG